MRKEYRIICLLILLGFPLSLSGQTVQAGMESSTAYVGQAVRYTIQISGSEKVERPQLTGFEKVRIEEAGESTSVRTSLFSGRNSKTVVSEYSWLITAMEVGKISIPSVSVTIDGKVFQTQEGILSVVEPGPIEGYHLILSVDNDKLFPGLPARVTLKWLFSSQVSKPAFAIPFLERPDLNIKNLPPPASGSNDIYQFSINGSTVYAIQSAEIYQGEQYASLSLSWDLYPSEPGFLELEPAILSFKKEAGRDGWGNTRYENAVIPSNPLSLQVEAIPEELLKSPGGILIAKEVLDFDIKVSPQRAYPGDPITVEIRLNNLSQPDMTTFNGLDSFSELQGRFRVDHGSLIAFDDDGILDIKQTVRAIDSSQAAFPSLPLLYYNQSKGTVEKLRTGPIALDIIPIDSSRGGSNNRVSPSLSKGETIGESETVDLYFNEVLLGIKGRGYQKIPIWFYLCIPPGLFLLSYLIMLFRSGNPRQFFISFLRRDDPVLSLKEQIRELRQDPTLEGFRKFYRFIRIWLSEQYHLESNFNSQQLSAAVSNTLDMTEKSKLLDFLEKLDKCCWSGTPPDKEELFSDFDPEWLYSIPGRKSS